MLAAIWQSGQIATPKLAVQVEGGQAIGFGGHGKVEGLQKGVDQFLFVLVASAGEQLGGDDQMGSRTVLADSVCKKCDCVCAAAETVDEDGAIEHSGFDH